MGFFIQLLMYLALVACLASRVPENFRLFYAIFPMTGVIEGFRSIFLKKNPMPWDLIMIGFIVSLVTFISGGFYFKRMGKYFADVA